MTLIARLRGSLIVSCQAYPGEPMRDARTMAQVARAVEAGGAAAVRVQGIEDVRAVSAGVTVPVIGLWKDGDQDVYITPTLRHAVAVAEAGADIVALDGTRRSRPDSKKLAQTISELRDQFDDVSVMADCGSLGDALAAQDAGADLIGTTLAGYTGERPATEGPDFALVDDLVAQLEVPVIAEGRVRTPEHAAEALARGAFAVCVGTAITHPTSITQMFVRRVGQGRHPVNSRWAISD